MLKSKDKLGSKFTNLKRQTTSSPLSKKLLKYPCLKKSLSATEQSTYNDFFNITDLIRSSSVIGTVIASDQCSKRVSFADVIGKDLAEVREYDEASDFQLFFANDKTMLPDEIPVVLSLSDVPKIKHFILFPQPSRNYFSFMNQLWKQKVCLDTAHIKNENVTGVIKVINLAFQKQVEIKVSFDSWKTYKIFPAQYHSSETMSIDAFTFQFCIPPNTKNTKFCIRYECDGNEFWDSNEGVDYCISAAFVQA